MPTPEGAIPSVPGKAADPHQPFRKPRSSSASRDGRDAPDFVAGGENARIEEPVVLDPEFHQSVWKPWQEPTDQSSQDAPGPSTTPAPATHHRTARAILLGSAGIVIFALVVVLLVPRFLAAETWRRDPLVQDMSTTAKIAWTAKGGQRCYATPDDDHAIFSDTTSVWSLDLRDGSTRWKVDLEGTWGTLVCLPESDVVSISEYGGTDTIVRTSLFAASSGAHLADLPGDEVAQVVPVGPYIGLLDRSNLLTAVTLDDPDTTLWSHQLPGPSEGLGPIFAMPFDESTTELLYTKSDRDGTGNLYRDILSTEDGTAPPWFVGIPTDEQRYERVADVIISHRYQEDVETVTALDLQGHELWSHEQQLGIIVGSRLYLASHPPTTDEFGYSELRQVVPRTGWPVNDDVYEESFFYAMEATAGHLAVVQTDSMRLLDEHLIPQPAISVLEARATFRGRKWIYVADNRGGEGSATHIHLSAIDPSGARTLWSLDLDPGQSVDQMGQHLVVIDADDETIHGLKS